MCYKVNSNKFDSKNNLIEEENNKLKCQVGATELVWG